AHRRPGGKPMKTLDIAKTTGPLAKIARDPAAKPLILTVKGKPVAVLLPIKDADVETISLSLNPEFHAIMEHSRRRQEREGDISTEEMRRRLGLDEPEGSSSKPDSQKSNLTSKTKRNGAA